MARFLGPKLGFPFLFLVTLVLQHIVASVYLRDKAKTGRHFQKTQAIWVVTFIKHWLCWIYTDDLFMKALVSVFQTTKSFPKQKLC